MDDLASYPFASSAASASAAAFSPLFPSGWASSSSPSRSSATPALLQRLGELPTRSHLHSSRTRRACVAMILRLRHPNDPQWTPLTPPLPKAPKQPRQQQKKMGAPTAELVPASSPEAVESAAVLSQVQSPSSAPKLSTAAPVVPAAAPTLPSPPPHFPGVTLAASLPLHAADADTLTRVPSSIPPAIAASTRARLRSLSEESWARESQLELLYMQRSQNPSDRWSGQMSFPGGRQAKGETNDEDTAVREVEEEIGWNLRDETKFVRIGQLDDKAMDGLKNVKPLAVAVFVYLQLCRPSPPLRLEPSEVSAVLFVPLSYLCSLRRPSDFGRIYHPLMLQVLQPRQQQQNASTTAANAAGAGAPLFPSSPAQKSFELRLIGYPHKREGRLLKEEASELLGDEQARDLAKLDDSVAAAAAEHELDDLPSSSAAAAARQLPPSLLKLRDRLRALAHELPLPLQTLPRAARLPHLLPALEQLASLRFPALSLPGVWTDARGRGGVSTQDDIRTLVHNLLPNDGTAAAAAASATAGVPVTPPPFILWGLTLERSCDLLLFLGHPFPFDYFARGSEKRKRLYAFWSNAGEARWSFERRVGAVRARRMEAAAATGAAPATVSSSSAHELQQSQQADQSSAALIASPFSSPLLLSRAREVVQPLREKAREAWQRQKQRLHLASKL